MPMIGWLFIFAACALIFAALLVNRWNALSRAIKALMKAKNPPQRG